MSPLQSANSRSQRCEPIKPAPPVTKILISGKTKMENETRKTFRINIFHFPFSVVHHLRCFSNNAKIRSYSSVQLSGRTKP